MAIRKPPALRRVSTPGRSPTSAPTPRRAASTQQSRVVSAPRHGLARVISKRGYCSRSQAEQWIRAGKVALNGRIVRDPEAPTDAQQDRISVDGVEVSSAAPLWIMMHKPRGLVTTTQDERGRDTVYALLADAGLPWLAPVGRLDKASEGLLLFTNDSAAAARLLAPESHTSKTYHVQIDTLPDASLLQRLREGVVDAGEHLNIGRVRELRRGERNAWLEIVLDEGRNRQIRRVLAAQGIGVLRLIRVAIGTLALADLGKGRWRHLSAAETGALTGSPDDRARGR